MSQQYQVDVLPVQKYVRPIAIAAEKVEERRTDFRYPTNEPVEMEVFNCDLKVVQGLALDVSRSGVRVALQDRVAQGAQVRIHLHNHLILGEVRYCRASGEGFQAGIKIQNIFYLPASKGAHFDEDDLSLYVLWKGLTTPEIVKLREHLEECESCRDRLNETRVILHKIRRHQERSRCDAGELLKH